MPLRLPLPRSLVGRVFALYSLALIGFVVTGLVLFFRYQFTLGLENAQRRADGLVLVMAPAIADSAVIGDYETIERTLQRAIDNSDFASAVFIDTKGGSVRAEADPAQGERPPAWLSALVAGRLFDTNLPLTVGGRDYGVLRLRYAPEPIAGALWNQALYALALSLAALVGGLVAIRMPLKRWLGRLDALQGFDADGRSPPATLAEADDTPIELRRTFEALNRAAASMQAQREQAAVTLGAIADGVLTLDPAGRVLLANPAACELLHLPFDGALGRPVQEILPGLLPEGVMPQGAWQAQRVRAGLHVLDITLSPIAAGDGAVVGHVLACRDVTEQSALEQRLRVASESREQTLTALRGVLEGLMPQAAGRMRGGDDDLKAITHLISELTLKLQERGEQLDAIFALSPDGFLSFDRAGAVGYVSPGFARMTGIAASDLIGLGETEFTALLNARCALRAGQLPPFAQMRAAGGAKRHLVEAERPKRRVFEVALRTGDDATVSQVLHLRDVTHQTEVERIKSEFLSTAAHELRTPMASIFGFVELMMYRKLGDANRAEALATVHRQARLMISIINELLDLARIESRGGLDFEIEPVDLAGLVREIVHDFKPPDARDGPLLQLPEGEVPAAVDRKKFAQALGNVLSNAYKYSPDGGSVDVTLRREGARLELVVTDHGIGMTAAQLARVGERFYRADASGNIPGTGLGMAIVKEIVEILGGELALASEAGAGTTVTMRLPAEAAAPRAVAAPA